MCHPCRAKRLRGTVDRGGVVATPFGANNTPHANRASFDPCTWERPPPTRPTLVQHGSNAKRICRRCCSLSAFFVMCDNPAVQRESRRHFAAPLFFVRFLGDTHGLPPVPVMLCQRAHRSFSPWHITACGAGVVTGHRCAVVTKTASPAKSGDDPEHVQICHTTTHIKRRPHAHHRRRHRRRVPLQC